MAGIRRDVAALGAGWNPTLEWYAKAVQQLQTLAPNKRTSWRYLAGIHGFDEAHWISKKIITDKDPLPDAGEWDGRMWKQCQHRTWYFLPWHRGYLHAFEAIVAATVKDLGGPADWALPYWNYLSGEASALQLPTAFTDPKMPDKKTDNPLAVPRKITSLDGTKLHLKAVTYKTFTSAANALSFGGAVTVFNHSAGAGSGELEKNPHNQVHVQIGELMGDPRTAGLDPIFWLHHCNVDRLWAAWLTMSENVMENGKAWLDGPPRKFEMPGPDGNLHVFTPADTMPGKPFAPTYDDLYKGTGVSAPSTALEEVSPEAAMPARLSSEPPPAAMLVGANSGKLTIADSPTSTAVRLQAQQMETAGFQGERRLFLNLENVRGSAPSAMLTVSLGIAESSAAPIVAESVALFGLGEASTPDGSEGGNGIGVAIDITDIANELAQGSETSLDQIEVHIEQDDAEAPVTIERVSIYTQAAS